MLSCEVESKGGVAGIARGGTSRSRSRRKNDASEILGPTQIYRFPISICIPLMIEILNEWMKS